MAVITVCPYSLKPLSDLSPKFLSDEHIIPHALGGPDALSVRADVNANSTFGSGVDSALIHDPQLRLSAAVKGVRSRSGEITVELYGKIVETGDRIGVTISKDGIGRRRLLDTHRKDPETGAIKLSGFDTQVDARIGSAHPRNATQG